ncbi:MAG: class I SAM-dependent methyltransferase [Ignavibacteria bacterium]|jgi:ubiquinone/menaquinone biosynthesis C-methylase UbiE|nr:class I SAM-dependent methyltransferase [Ignavibacteria bacterium]
MKNIDEENATADELWDYCLLEYKNRNLITKRLFDNFFSRLAEIIKTFESDSRILEVGCGAGESSKNIIAFLKGQYFEASDFDKRYVEKLKSMKPKYRITVESVYSLNRNDNEFDHIIMTEVLEHLDDYRLALKELFRVARKSVVISVPNEPLWRILNMVRFRYLRDLGNTPGHLNHFSKKSLIKELKEFGTIKKVFTPVPWIMIECEKGGY